MAKAELNIKINYENDSNKLAYYVIMNILYFADQWDDKWRRRQQIALRLSRLPEVGKLIYVELPLSLTSLVKYLLGKADGEANQRWKRVFEHGFTFEYGRILVITPFSLWPYFSAPALKGANLKLVKRSIISKLPEGFKPDVFWSSLPFDALWLEYFNGYKMIYDCSEQFSEFQNWLHLKTQVTAWDTELTQKASTVIVQTQSHKESKARYNNNILVIPNAVDQEVFGAGNAEIGRLEGIQGPVLGYIGSLNYRFDTELVRSIAEERPDWSIVLVGNNSIEKSWQWPSNVHFMPGIGYGQVPGMLTRFDVCLLPHLRNKLVESESPIKLFDYLASGKPIVSQKLAGVIPYAEYVYLAENKQEFLVAIEKALKEDAGTKAKRKKYGLTQTWASRVNQIKEYL